MKKIYSLLLVLSLITTLGFSQSSFGFVEKFGFDGQNGSVTTMASFKGKLYAGMGNYMGQIYSSSTADPSSFSKVYDPLLYGNVKNFTVSSDGAGYLFASLKGGAGFGQRTYGTNHTMATPPSKVVRTIDGITWEDYYELPFGSFGQLEVTAINVFKGTGLIDSVYIAYVDDSGNARVVRNSLSANDFAASATWEEVLNFSTDLGSSASITSSVVFGGKLIYSTNDNRIYETTDGVNYSENTSFYNAIGGGSLAGNSFISSMNVFNSDLYLGTNNPNQGQLWKTNNGTTFDSLVSINGFFQIKHLLAAGGKIWIIATDNQQFQIGSYNGVSYTIENNNEFGSTDIEAENNSSVAEFNNHIYFGVEHYNSGMKRFANNPKNKNNVNRLTNNNPDEILEMYSNGGQIWRTCLVGPMPVVSINNGVDTIVCNGAPVVLNASAGFNNYLWLEDETTQAITATATGFYAVTVTGANGCKNTAEYTILNPTTIDVTFNDSITNTAVSPILVCEGNTTPTLIAKPESDSYGLKLENPNKGFVTPGSTAFASRQLTIELWINPSSTNNGMIVTEYDLGGAWSLDNHDVIEYYGGTIYVELPGMSETNIGNVPVNQWSHVVLRYDGTTLKGFINGVLSGGSTGSWAIPTSGSDAFKIGHTFANGTGSNGTMEGIIKDLRIWNLARTDSAIIADMNNLPAGVYPELIYHYPLNEGTGAVANDISGNANHSVNLTGTFVIPQAVTITPAVGAIDLGNNYFQFNPIVTTNYNASYTNAAGCLVNTDFTVEVPKVNFTGSLPSVCGGVDASIYMTTPGSYTITPSVIDANPFFTPSPQPTVSTWYYVSGFSANGGCAINDSILINVGPTFLSNVGNPLPLTPCEESNVTLDALASDGTAPYTFYWQASGNTPFDTTNVDSLSYYAGSLNSSVTVTGIDAIGCPLSPPVTFAINPTISSTLTGLVTTPPPTSINIDNGFVYIFKHQPGNAGFDTIGYTPLNANGEYAFNNLLAGDYLIKALPDEVSFPLAVPTYYGNAFQWDSSLVYTHGCVQADTANIQIVVSTQNTIGPGAISGFILEGQAFGTNRLLGPGTQPNNPFVPGGPLKGIDVKLGKNPGGGIQARTMSDSTGYYVFDSLPVGGYTIYVDIPNLPMDSTRSVVISGADSSIQNNYFADSASIYINPDTISSVGIYSSAKSYENKFSIYPNPAKDLLYINYELEKESKVGFEITNVFGQVIKTEPMLRHTEGKNIFIFNINQLNLSGGVYFISILNENKKYTQRVVLIE